MNLITAINSLFALISFPSMVVGFIYFGRKLEKLDSIVYDINHFIKPELKDLGKRVGALEVRMEAFEVRMGVVGQSLENLEQILYRNTA